MGRSPIALSQPYADAVNGSSVPQPTQGAPVVVLMPVKAFRTAKARLAPSLDAPARARLARDMADNVFDAAYPLPVAIVCDDPEVASWATERQATVLWEVGKGLNGAVLAAVKKLAAVGVREVLVAHADLPFATGLSHLSGFDGVTVVPDRRNDGSNVVCVPAHAGFVFAYGSGSFQRHCEEATRLALPLRIIHEPTLAWDIDTPSDLPGHGPVGELA